MSEFDVNLISAFAKCPAFYDKSNPNFKDRAFTENAWKEISLQLGFDEKVLRDRMFQLRNRYNLEKRKVEMQDGDPNAKSTWPLFDRMSFLEGHIRPRKSYKSIMNRSMENNEQQFANNAMFFNHRNNQQMRQYSQHPFAVQNAHNARLQQLASHIHMMANNADDPSIDLNGDSFPGLPNNLAMELSLLEGDDRTNSLHLFQQQQQQQLNLQQHQQQQQLVQRQQFLRRGGVDNNSEIKAEYYSESDDDEDGLRDTETDTTSKSKDDVLAPFGQRITDATSSAQALSELLNIVTEEESPSGGGGARSESQPRNGTVSEPGQSTGNEVDDAFLNPMDILINRQSTGSAQNMRYSDPQKRKSDTSAQGHLQTIADGRSTVAGINPTFKRRRRNYQNMIPRGLMMQDTGNHGMGRPAMMLGTNQNTMPSAALQGSNAMLANQAVLLAQLQNTLASQQTFLQQSQGPAMDSGRNTNNNSSQLPDKYVAFGQFMASSLSELSEVTALDLIAKFTVEVVNALRDQKSGEASSVLAGRTTAQSSSSAAVQQQQQQDPESHNHTNNLNANTASTNNNHLLQTTNNIGGDKYQTQHQF